MNNTPRAKRGPLARLSMLVAIVLLFFSVLLASYAIGGITLYALIKSGIIALGERNLHIILLFLLLVSLAIGTIFTMIGGAVFLRPVQRLVAATKEVAAGNFDVRVEANGPYEMQRLGVSFNEMASELAGMETLRNDFISNISHEFKTPVASIRGFARLLKRNSLTDAQREEYLDIILLESERLSQLSGNVLLLSNLDTTDHAPEKADFYLDEQLRQSVLLLEPLLEKNQLEIEIELEPIHINASEELLGHVWLNLLSNAIKFTPPGGTIRLLARRSGNAAIVSVQDTGIGIGPETQKRLFDKFYQGDPSRSTQGNGLGLSLVKRILALCGGSISLRSEEGQGSTFTITLPLG